MDKDVFKLKYNPYGHLGGNTNFSQDLNSVIKDEIEKFAHVLYVDSCGILDIRNITKDYNVN